MSRSDTGLDLRLVPAAVTAWLTTGWALGQPLERILLTGALGAGAFVAALVGRRWTAAAIALVVVLASLSASLRVLLLHESAVADLARERATVTARVRVDSDARVLPARGVRPALGSTSVTAEWIEGRGMRHEGSVPLRLVGSGDLVPALTRPPVGGTIEVQGRLAPSDRGSGVAAELRMSSPPVGVAEPGAALRAVNHVRAALVATMSHSPPDQAGLVPSLVVGDTSGLPDEVREQFRDVGLTHLTAVSGTNLTLLLVFLMTAARWLGARGRWLWGVQLLGVAFFVILCRAEPSVVRASAMGLVALAALGRTRDPRRGIRHLSAAVLLLVLLDPGLARSWGFALSVTATAGILALGPGLVRATSWLPRSVAEAVAVPTAAQIATTPLVVALSGEIAVAGLAANVLVAPFVGPATVVGLVAALVGSVWVPAGVPFGWVAGWIVEPLLLVASLGAALPGAGRPWPVAPPTMVLLVVACVLAAVTLPWILRRRGVALLIAVGLVVALGRAPSTPGWPGPWQVVFCDVGQGDATVIRAGPRSAVLVDVGPEAADTLACLDELGVVNVPLLVLTHFHADHVGGLAGVLAQRRVARVLTSAHSAPAPAATAVEELTTARKVPLEVARAGQQWQVGEVWWTTLHAGNPAVGSAPAAAHPEPAESGIENDASVVGAVDLPGLTVLLPGDLEPTGQRAMLAALARQGRTLPTVHVVKMPHHGSSRQDPTWWEATGARLAVASAGRDNDYGHPSERTLALARRLGMEVARTDQQGSVAIWVDGPRLMVRTSGAGDP